MREHFRFSGLRELLAKANEEKSGDQVAAASERERVAAQIMELKRSGTILKKDAAQLRY
jgi:ethanolamine ammonia-lyase large subunit